MPIITTYPEIHDKSFVKSHYKLYCFCCDNTINVGDEITMTVESGGIILRPRILNKQMNNLSMFYIPDTACRWVHKDCEVNNIWTLYSASKASSNIDFDNDNNNDSETDSETDSYHDLASYIDSSFASDLAFVNEEDLNPENDGGDIGGHQYVL